jgi:hypothetical protein
VNQPFPKATAWNRVKSFWPGNASPFLSVVNFVIIVAVVVEVIVPFVVELRLLPLDIVEVESSLCSS